MQESDSVAIDLPQKILVTERSGEVSVYYNSPNYLADRHDITNQNKRLDNISDLLQRIAASGREG